MASLSCNLLQPLSDQPVQGVSLASVSCLRLDLYDALAPGNKHFKLQPYIDEAVSRGIDRLVSFGGPWSNHLHALAARGHDIGLDTVGIVRGSGADTATLTDARNWGMEIRRVSYSEYRRRYDPAYLAEIEQHFAPCIVIPEGGADARGARGAMEILSLLEGVPTQGRVVLAVGSGSTLAGLSAASKPDTRVTGISALKSGANLEERIEDLLASLDSPRCAPWELIYDYHCGGFARVTPELESFQCEFEAVQGIPLDPVYTAKAFYGVHDLLRRRIWSPEEAIVVIHTGGLQGRRGFSQRASDPAR